MTGREIFENELMALDTRHEDKLILGHDFQGWPVEAMTLREVLEALGFKETENGYLLEKNEENNQLLNAYPRLLTDDGMGYGVDPRFICEADTEVYDEEVGGKKIQVFNIFREKYFLDLEKENEDK